MDGGGGAVRGELVRGRREVEGEGGVDGRV